MTITIDHIKTQIASLSKADKEAALIEQYNHAITEQNHALAEQIANHIIGDPEPQHFSPRLNLFCLEYLLDRAFENAQTLKTNEEKENHYAFFLNLLWKFKWIIPELPYDIDMEQSQIEEAVNMMRHYYEHFEFSPKPIYACIMLQNIAMGDAQKARENFQNWQNAPEEPTMSDCEACILADKIYYYRFIGDYQKTIDTAAPILSGDLSCSEVPESIYNPVLHSMIARYQFDEARTLLPAALDAILNNSNLTHEIAELIENLVRLGETELAEHLADEHHIAILESCSSLTALRFFIATSHISETNYQNAKRLAISFDERNGNQYYQQYLAEFSGRNLLGKSHLQ